MEEDSGFRRGPLDDPHYPGGLGMRDDPQFLSGRGMNEEHMYPHAKGDAMHPFSRGLNEDPRAGRDPRSMGPAAGSPWDPQDPEGPGHGPWAGPRDVDQRVLPELHRDSDLRGRLGPPVDRDDLGPDATAGGRGPSDVDLRVLPSRDYRSPDDKGSRERDEPAARTGGGPGGRGDTSGDTDMRTGEVSIYDVDFRQLGTAPAPFEAEASGLPFKVPLHSAATEIEASINSHPPIYYEVVKVFVPKPNFSHLKVCLRSSLRFVSWSITRQNLE